MSYEYNCTNCGKTGYGSSSAGPMSGSNPPSGWITKWASTKIFCSNRCKDEFNKRNESVTNSSNYSSASSSDTDYSGAALKLQAEADKLRAENEENRILQEQQARAKEKVESNIRNIASLNFGSTQGEITNVLDQLLIIGSSKPSPKERMAIHDKMELGVMKLKMIGVTDCSFYELKMQKIKPSLFQKIIYFLNNN